MSKQDRQGARTVSALEQRYSFGKSFAEVQGLADDARKAADDAKEAAEKLNNELTSEEIFNRLTNNGELQGLYRGDDGDLYVNATYIKSGELLADLVKAGVIKSKDGTGVVIDLDNGTSTLAKGISAEFVSTGSAVDSIRAFVKAELITMKTGTSKDFVVLVDDGKHPGGAALAITKYKDANGELSGVARFEWSDGSTSIIEATNETADGDDDAWHIFGMTWCTPTLNEYGSRYFHTEGNELEYVNPPMILGKEYRTTERWNGKVVYTCLYDCGNFPNASENVIEHGLQITQVIRCAGVDVSAGATIPRIEANNAADMYMYAGVHEIVIRTTEDYSGRQVYAHLWYTKD